MKKLNINYWNDSDLINIASQTLGKELGLVRKEQFTALKIVLLNLYYEKTILVRRAKYSYGANRYNPRKLGYSSLRTVLDSLDQYAYITQEIGTIKAGERKLTKITRTESLTNWFIENNWYDGGENIYRREILPNLDCDELVILRSSDANKKLLDYSDTHSTNKYREDLQAYNQLLDQHEIYITDWSGSDYLYDFDLNQKVKRMFISSPEHNFDLGGRLYASWCDLSKDLRKKLMIDFSKTVELDYQASAINTLYIQTTGEPYPSGDPYCFAIDGIYIAREIVKKILNISLFTSSLRGLEMALDNCYLGSEDYGDEYAKLKKEIGIQNIFDGLMDKHSMIKDYFLKSKTVGLHIQFLESERVMNVINELTQLNIPVLTIYDSFIVRESDVDTLKELMC